MADLQCLLHDRLHVQSLGCFKIKVLSLCIWVLFVLWILTKPFLFDHIKIIVYSYDVKYLSVLINA